MKWASEEISIYVSESIGSVSALHLKPDNAKVILVLAHGAGAGMRHPFMESLAIALTDLSIATLRYNFPFMENDKKRPDPPAIAQKTVQAAIHKARELHHGLPMFVGGKSFGGRMTSQLLAKDCPEFVKGIVFVGFPLHPANQPSTDRAQHLSEIRVPMLFLQGTRDALAFINLVEKVVSTLPTATLTKFEKADHSFKVGKINLVPELAHSIAKWVI